MKNSPIKKDNCVREWIDIEHGEDGVFEYGRQCVKCKEVVWDGKKDNEKQDDWQKDFQEMSELIHYRFRSNSYWERTMEELKSFVEGQREAGKKEAIEYISHDMGWEESEEMYKKKLLKKVIN